MTITQNFEAQGYVPAETPLAAQELALLRRVCDQLLEEPPEDNIEGLHKIRLGRRRQFLSHRHEEFPELEAFLLNGTPARLAQSLFGKAYLFNEQFVVKGPKKGASFAWHQDGAYVGFDHKAYLTVWMALDDVSEANGCVYLLPRNLAEKPDLDPHKPVEEGSGELNGYFGDETGAPLQGSAGLTIGFSSLTLHRSGPNGTDNARRAFIAQYSPEPIIDPATGAPKRFAKPIAA